MPTAMITGLGGTRLSQAEADFLRAVQPCGLILFARNCETPAQVLQLVTDAKAATGLADLLVLIDQEGGRVRRLKSPAWRDLPPAAAYAALYRKDAAEALRAGWLSARLTADELGAAGINTNCAPVLDVPVSGSHDIIGDRAYGTTVAEVVRLGRAVAEGYVAGGVLPVIKHIPGHGRARADSHFDLPVVDASRQELSATDFAAFRAFSDYPAAMTAHVVFDSIHPRAPASAGESGVCHRAGQQSREKRGRLGTGLTPTTHRGPLKPWCSRSTASKGRSTYCWRWRVCRRSTSPGCP